MRAIHSELFAKILMVITIITQGALINKFIALWLGNAAWTWTLADLIVVGSLFAVELSARRKLIERRNRGDDDPSKDDKPDTIRFVYITWILYALFLSVRVGILFHEHAHDLEEKEDEFYGPNLLKTAVSFTPVVFFTMINGHHNGKNHVKREYYISLLIGTVCFDLFDSIELLEYLFTPIEVRPFSQHFADALLAFSILNFFLPILALLELRVNHFSGRTPSMLFKTCYMLAFVFLVNVPNLIMRALLWHQHTIEVSVLLMKNVMCILVGFFELYEYLKETRPKKCGHCGRWYELKAHRSHKEEVCKSVRADSKNNSETEAPKLFV